MTAYLPGHLAAADSPPRRTDTAMTKIEDVFDVDTAEIQKSGPHVIVRVRSDAPDTIQCAVVDRAEFLAAVAAELDVIVIDRADLPEVVPHPRLPKTFTVGGGKHATHSAHDAKYARERGIGYLAIAEHLDQNPPVDEAAVDALERALADLSLDNRLAKADVRALVAAGVRAPQAGDDQ